MKKQLIALRGPSKVGKSTAIHSLYKLLVADPIVKPLSFESHGRLLDFVAIVEIEDCKIGLVNRGDIPAVLKKLLKELARKRCDVIVCAARTKGAVDKLLASFDPPYQLVQLAKSPSKSASNPVSKFCAAHEFASLVFAAIDA